MARQRKPLQAPEATDPAPPDPVEPPVLDSRDPEQALPDPPSPPPPPSRAPVWPMVLGGALAATMGAVATYGFIRTQPGLVGPPSTAGLEQRLSDQDARLTDLAEAVASLPQSDRASPKGPDAAQLIAPLEFRLAAMEAEVAGLADRLSGLERRPAASGAGPDLTAASEAMKAAEESARQMKDEAARMARQATLSEALARIDGALEGGQTLAPGLEGLRRAGVEVPEALLAVEQGAPTLQALRDNFPEAAREAISLSLAAAPAQGAWGRIGAFLRSQSGARSLSPRAGDDPDAILSRAEAALTANDLGAAIAEISALPPEGLARMQEWVTLAGRRLAATGALADLRAGGQP